MTVVLGGWGIRRWRWPGAAAVCAAAMVASCGVTGAHGGPAHTPAAVAGARAGRVLGYRLNSVAALSDASAWATGLTNQATLHVLRWDGQTWRQVPVRGGGDFNGVAALSAANAWAVGYGPGGTQALIEHWNGTAWRPVATPRAVGPAILHAVDAVSPDDVWAVGGTTNPTGQAVILHWNGTAWTRVSSRPQPGVSSELNGVAAVSASNAWAVGDANTKTHGIPLIEHWNGTTWRPVPSPALRFGGVLAGVAATSATNAWAVGVRYGRATGGLIEHWNGTAWTLARSPALASGGLTGVTALSGTSAWAVGGTFPGSQPPRTVIERWNGTFWALVPSPAPGYLASVTATSARNAWAVGVSAPTRNATGVIEHWDGNSWTCISATGTAGPCPAG